jgi:hypothetical protein
MDTKELKDKAAAATAAQARLGAEAGTADEVEAQAIEALVMLVKAVLPAVSKPILDYHAEWNWDDSKHREDVSHVFGWGVILVDGFTSGRLGDGDGGSYYGWRLCLSRAGRLFEQQRFGEWSSRQGACSSWSAGYSPDGHAVGSSQHRTPAEVAAEWNLDAIAQGVERVAAAAEAQQRQHSRDRPLARPRPLSVTVSASQHGASRFADSAFRFCLSVASRCGTLVSNYLDTISGSTSQRS